MDPLLLETLLVLAALAEGEALQGDRTLEVTVGDGDDRGKGSAHDRSSRGNAEPQKKILWGRQKKRREDRGVGSKAGLKQRIDPPVR